MGSWMVRAGGRGGWSPRSSLRTDSATFCGADHQARQEGGRGGFQGLRGAEPQLRRSGGAVLRCDRPLRDPHGNLDIISMSPVPANTSPRVHASVHGCFWKNLLLYFYVKVDPNPEADRCSPLETLDNFCELLVSHQSMEAFRKKANSDPEVHKFSERRLWRF